MFFMLKSESLKSYFFKATTVEEMRWVRSSTCWTGAGRVGWAALGVSMGLLKTFGVSGILTSGYGLLDLLLSLTPLSSLSILG